MSVSITALSSKSTKERRAALEAAVRGYLDGPDFHAEGGSLSTHDLLEHIWPEQLAHAENITRRRRLYDDLGYLAKTSLINYNSPGAPKEIMGRVAVPRRWHKAVAKAKPFAPKRWAMFDWADGLEGPAIAEDPANGQWVRWDDVKELFE